MTYFIDSEKAKKSSSNANDEGSQEKMNPEYKFETAKKILYFTSYFGMHDWMFGFGNQPFLDHKCPVTNCYITNKRDNICKRSKKYYFFNLLDYKCFLPHGPFNINFNVNPLIEL